MCLTDCPHFGTEDIFFRNYGEGCFKSEVFEIIDEEMSAIHVEEVGSHW